MPYSRLLPSSLSVALLCLGIVMALPGNSAQAQEPEAAATSKPVLARSVAEILEASKASDWRELDPANTIYMELDSGRVVIELAPAFAPEHVANIRTFAREGYWDGMSINRSQDNFVVQWGDANAEDKDKVRPLGDADARLPDRACPPRR